MLDAATAHVRSWLQARADGRPFWPAEQEATIILIELNATHAGWLAVWHPWNG
jgi:hypothetical protein